MDVKCFVVSETTLRRLILRYNVLYEQKDMLFKVIDEMYMGRISNLLYKMVSSYSKGFEIPTMYNDSDVTDMFNVGMNNYMNMVSKLNVRNLEMKVVGVSPITSNDFDILPEYGKIINVFNWYSDRETMVDLHNLLMSLLVCFNDYIFDCLYERRDSGMLLCIINNNDELKLIFH